MRTTTELRRRCTNPGGWAHWIWTGPLSAGSPAIFAPNYTGDPTGKTCMVQRGPRAAWHLHHRCPVPAGQWLYMGCGNPLCVKAACVAMAGSRAELNQRLHEQGRFDTPACRRTIEKMAAARRAMTAETYARACDPGTNLRALGREVGMSPENLWKTRAGERNASLALGPWAQLVRRA